MAEKYLPYGRQIVDEEDIRAVADVLRSDWLTTGPMVERFEETVCRYVGAPYGVAVSSGTAALHAAMFALGVAPGDEVIVPAMTFAATANCVVYQGAKPVFADVDPATLLLEPDTVEALITPRTKAVIGVDYAGQPCDWEALRQVADRHGLALVADSCHALGATLRGRRVGSLADITCFSFHPVKHITTGEGGMAVTADGALARRMRLFRNHGISTSAAQREKAGEWLQLPPYGYPVRFGHVADAQAGNMAGPAAGTCRVVRESFGFLTGRTGGAPPGHQAWCGVCLASVCDQTSATGRRFPDDARAGNRCECALCARASASLLPGALGNRSGTLPGGGSRLCRNSDLAALAGNGRSRCHACCKPVARK